VSRVRNCASVIDPEAGPRADWIAPGTFLIILGAGPQQVPAYEMAAKLGVPALAVDGNAQAPGFDLADRKIVASVKDAEQCLLALQHSGLNFSGVMTSGVEVAPVVSAIAARFGLIAVSEKVARNTTHKGARYTKLSKADVPTPGFLVLTDGDACGGQEFPLPCVVKPTDSSGSRGVRLVRERSELADACTEAANLSSEGDVILEEYTPGAEISIEGFIHDGDLKITGFAERNFIDDSSHYPYFLEDGSTIPASFPDPVDREARDLFRQAVQALEIDAGPAKGDLVVTDAGVLVIEITSRLSPGFASRIVPLTSGVELLDATIRWATAGPVPAALFEPKFERAMAHRYYRHQAGRITAIRGLDDLHHMPGVKDVMVVQPFQVGDVLAPLSYMSRLFYIITVGESADEAVGFAESALASVQIDVEPKA